MLAVVDSDGSRGRWMLVLRSATRGHLRLHGLPPWVRWTSLLLIATILAAAAVMLVAVAAPDVGAPGDGASGAVPPWPRLATVVFGAGLALVAATAAAATRLPRARFPRATLLGIAFVGASVGAAQLVTPGTDGPARAASGAIALASSAALTVAALDRRPSRWPPLALAVLAGLPAAAWLATLLVAIGAGEPALESAATATAGTYVGLFGIAGGVLALWGSFSLMRTARSIGVRVTASASRVGPVIAALVVLKLGWAAAGYGSLIPGDLAGEREAWVRSRDDGALAWLAATVMVLAAGILVARMRRRVDERGVRATFWIVVGAFAVPAALGAVGVMLVPFGQLIGPGAVDAIGRLLAFVSDLFLPIEAATILVLPLVAALVWRAGSRSVGVCIAILAASALPVTIAVTGIVLGAWSLDDATPADALVAEPLTVDTVLTLIVAIVGLRALRGHPLPVDARLLAVALVVSTLLTHAGLLVPGSVALAANVLLLLYPIAWLLVADAGPANLPGPARAHRVLSVLGATAGLVLLAMLPLAAGDLPADAFSEFARALLVLPFGLSLVLAWWGREQALPRLDARTPRPAAPTALLERADRLTSAERAGWSAVAIVLVGVVAWGMGDRQEATAALASPPEASSPAAAPTPAPTPMRAADIEPGTLVFGSGVDLVQELVLEPREEFGPDALIRWVGILRAPTSGSGLVLRLARDGMTLGDTEVTMAAGGVWVVFTGDLTFVVPGRYTLSYVEGGTVLAEGSLQVVVPGEPATPAPAGPASDS